jgi:hypothetical protein
VRSNSKETGQSRFGSSGVAGRQQSLPSNANILLGRAMKNQALGPETKCRTAGLSEQKANSAYPPAENRAGGLVPGDA